MPAVPALLAFDTSTEHMSVALGVGERTWLHDGAGGAQASAALIPTVLGLLAQAGLRVAQLDAIAFGRGPGAFTGLRTACAAAQGLALGAGRPVLALDTLMAVAEDARGDAAAPDLWVAMDARMNEIYAAHYRFAAGQWQVAAAPMLTQTEALNERWRAEPPRQVAGTALRAFAGRLQTGAAAASPDALPRAKALLPLARAAWARGDAVDAALALPVYLRDKVAQTTAEREAVRRAAEAGAASR